MNGEVCIKIRKREVLIDVCLVGSAACSRFGSAGREQASIQQGRAIQAGLKFNFGHFVPELTFQDLVALLVFFRFSTVLNSKNCKVVIPSRQSFRHIRFTSLYPLPDPVRGHTGTGR